MESIIGFIKKYRIFIAVICFGIIARLLASFLFTHYFDFSNILAIVKSVADTGDISHGFYVVSNSGHAPQLYGKIYYQIIALWVSLLGYIHIIDLKYLFDVGPFKNPHTYMLGFSHMGPEVYQIISIKTLQFIFDIAILIFALKIATLLQLKNKLLIVIFWAFNPLFIYPAFVMFQADTIMTACLLGGIYFAIKSLHKQEKKVFSINVLLCLILLTCGAVIKQIPLLFIPIFLILLVKNIKSFMVYIAIIFASYIAFYQPWSSDVGLLKNYFLSSPETLTLFAFQINSVPIFYVMYLLLIFLVFRSRSNIQQNPSLIIPLSVLTICTVYIPIINTLFFPQFNLWILPFLILLTLYDKRFAIFFIAPILGFLKHIITDNGFYNGTSSIALGQPLSDTVEYKELLANIVHESVPIGFLNTVVVMFYIVLAIICVQSIKKGIIVFPYLEKTFISKISTTTLIVLLLVILNFFLIGDFIYKTRYSQITNATYTNIKPLELSRKPITVNIQNPREITLTSLVLRAKAQSVKSGDSTIVQIKDLTNSQILSTTKLPDYKFSTSDNKESQLIYIPLSKSVNEKDMMLIIFKEQGNNSIVLFESTQIPSPDTYLSKYGNFYKTYPITFEFPTKTFELNFRGQDKPSAMVQQFVNQIKRKPSFFAGYFMVILFLSTTGVILILPSLLHRRKKTSSS